jgi:hypothetical protein
MSFVAIFTVLQVIGYSGLAVRFWQTGLSRTYRFFFAFLIFESLRVALAAMLPRGSDMYARFYFTTQPALWLFHALMTLEVFKTALQAHPGIATTSRKLIALCLSASVIFAAATVAVDVQRHESTDLILSYFFTLERVVNCSLLLFVVLLMVALAWFPFPLTRNALVHASIFSFFFFAKTVLMLLLVLLGPGFYLIASWTLLAATVSSLILWGTLLTPAGEQSVVRSGYQRDPQTEERLLSQLESLNRSLGGSVRKAAEFHRDTKEYR